MNSGIRNSDTGSSKRSRTAKLVALVGVVVLGASACTSDPSAQRVAKDLVNTPSLGLSETQRDCMLDKIDDYSKDELEDISKNAAKATETQNVGQISELQKFEDDLASCV